MLRNNRKKISGRSKLLKGSSSQTLKKTLVTLIAITMITAQTVSAWLAGQVLMVL